MKRTLKLTPLVLLLTATYGMQQASAATIYKATTAGNLNATTSWYTSETGPTNPNAIGSTDTLWFGGSGQAGSIVGASLGGDMAVGAVRLDNKTGTPNYNVTVAAGNTLTLNANNDYAGGIAQGIVLNSASGGSMTINANIALGAAQQWVSSRSLTIAGNVDLASKALTFWTAGSSTTTVTGAFSNGAGLNKISSGTLVLGSASLANTGTINVTGGRLTLSRNASGGIGLGPTGITLANGRELLVAYGTGVSGGSVTMDDGSSLGLQNGGGTSGTFAPNIVLASGTGAANAASIGGFIYGNNTTLTGTISGSGDLRWRTGILGGGSNSASVNAANNNSGWAVNSYTGATSFEGVNLNFNLASSIDNDVVNPFGASANVATINGGATLRFNQTGAAGNTTIIENDINLAANSGQTTTLLREDGNLKLTGDVNVTTAGTGKVVIQSKWGDANGGKHLALEGVLSGSGNLTIGRKDNDGEIGIVALTNNANTYNGTITIDTTGGGYGFLELAADGAATSAALNLGAAGAQLRVNTANATIASLTGIAGTNVSSRTGGNNTLTVNQSANTTFAGTLGGTGGVTGSAATLSLVKDGAGTLELTGANTYTGGTTVSAGTLLVNNATGSGLGTGNAIVNGGILGGTGSFTGTTTINTGGTVSPGTSIGTLSVGATTLNGNYLLETASGSLSDLLNVTGGLTLTGSSVLDLDSLSSLVPTETYMIAAFTGGLTGTFGTVDPAILATHFVDYGTSQINLVPVPEPGTFAMLLFGAMYFWAVGRKRQR